MNLEADSMTSSAVNALLSILAGGVLIVVPAAFLLIWVSQKDAISR